MKIGVYHHVKSDNRHIVVQDNVLNREGRVHCFFCEWCVRELATGARGYCLPYASMTNAKNRPRRRLPKTQICANEGI